MLCGATGGRRRRQHCGSKHSQLVTRNRRVTVFNAGDVPLFKNAVGRYARLFACSVPCVRTVVTCLRAILMFVCLFCNRADRAQAGGWCVFSSHAAACMSPRRSVMEASTSELWPYPRLSLIPFRLRVLQLDACWRQTDKKKLVRTTTVGSVGARRRGRRHQSPRGAAVLQ